ncbi:hypothetical protein EDD15DRAFT_2193500 [Pisolithus albus]|nr:hypothetical protein EDD15DRAFT_2193500 [Pisolithus albus]
MTTLKFVQQCTSILTTRVNAPLAVLLHMIRRVMAMAHGWTTKRASLPETERLARKVLWITNSATEEIVTVHLYCNQLLYYFDQGAPAPVVQVADPGHGHRPGRAIIQGLAQLTARPEFSWAVSPHRPSPSCSFQAKSGPDNTIPCFFEPTSKRFTKQIDSSTRTGW